MRNQTDLVFHALSDGTRRSMLMRLTRQDYTVTALARHYPMSLNAVSKHLKTLEQAKLIGRRRVGTMHRISLRQEALLPAERWMALYAARWNRQLDSLEQFIARRKGKA